MSGDCSQRHTASGATSLGVRYGGRVGLSGTVATATGYQCRKRQTATSTPSTLGMIQY